MTEAWKDVVGFEGVYMVSNLGRVKSLTRKVWNYTKPGRTLKTHMKKNGYLQLSLKTPEKDETKLIYNKRED